MPAGEAEIAQLGQLHNGGCYAGKQVAVQLKLGEAGGVRQRSKQLLAWLSHRERLQLRQLDVVQHLCLLLDAFSVNAQRGHQGAHTLQQGQLGCAAARWCKAADAELPPQRGLRQEHAVPALADQQRGGGPAGMGRE